MLEAHQNWFIATKQVEAISSRLQQELEALGCEVLHDPMYIHAHFFIPEDVYPHADETMKRVGFTLSEKHPPICSIEHQDNFEVFEKRVPIIEVRESKALKALFDQGVSMSGGAGRPHIHIKIPDENKQQVVELLAEHQYLPHHDYARHH
ncbi:MAG: hypothetical protein HQL46_01445 [Gammaproteobacteria bacterium]|nr:hypothetical protein [Gammaproteobacteria bacterium]